MKRFALIAALLAGSWTTAADPQPKPDPFLAELKRIAPGIQWHGYVDLGEGVYFVYGRTLSMSIEHGNPTPRDFYGFIQVPLQKPGQYDDARRNRKDITRLVVGPKMIPSPVNDNP